MDERETQIEARTRELEDTLIEEHGETFVERDESYFAKMSTRPGPTPQGLPGVSRG